MWRVQEHRAGEFRFGDYPILIDCRDGTFSLHIDGRKVRMRPLRWSEKRRLARLASAGIEDTESLLLTTCALDPVPSDPRAREAIIALARWVNASSGDSDVPLDPRAVAAVTIGVCRAVGARPEDLDDRDAVEVEAMWGLTTMRDGRNFQGADEASTPGRERSVDESRTTRILFASDPSIATSRADRTAGIGETRAERIHPLEVDTHGQPECDSPRSTRAERPPSRVRRAEALRPENLGGAHFSARAGIAAPLFETTLTQSEIQGLDDAVAPADATRGASEDPSHQPLPADVRHRPHTTIPRPWMSASSPAVPYGSSPGESSANALSPALAVMSPLDAGQLDAPARPSHVDHGDLFEEFAQRLARAAREMGIWSEE